MKQRQEILSSILTSKYGKGATYPNSINQVDLIKAGLVNEVNRIYFKLGGILGESPLSFGKWDICLGEFIVELNEEQHFNRYRAITLSSYIYHLERGFDVFDYGKFCQEYEFESLKKSTWGKYWTSLSAERQFGNAGVKRDLEILGFPRWKQRAFYDYLRDVFAMIYRIRVIRLSIYDKIIINSRIESIGSILLEMKSTDLNEIVNFIEEKAKIIR
jgi:hypothetical protein